MLSCVIRFSLPKSALYQRCENVTVQYSILFSKSCCCYQQHQITFLYISKNTKTTSLYNTL